MGMCQPACKPDFTITSKDFAYNEASPGNIPWSAVVGPIELKWKMWEAKWGRLQVVETAWQVLHCQTGRHAVYGMVVAGTQVQFLQMTKDGELTHTPLEPILHKRTTKEPPMGFKQLVAFMGMGLEVLGGMDSSEPESSSSSEGWAEEEDLDEEEAENEEEGDEDSQSDVDEEQEFRQFLEEMEDEEVDSDEEEVW